MSLTSLANSMNAKPLDLPLSSRIILTSFTLPYCRACQPLRRYNGDETERTVLNRVSRSSLVTNLLRPAMYISRSFASLSVRSFLRSGFETYTESLRPSSMSVPLSSNAFSADVCRGVSALLRMRLARHVRVRYIAHSRTDACS